MEEIHESLSRSKIYWSLREKYWMRNKWLRFVVLIGLIGWAYWMSMMMTATAYVPTIVVLIK